MVPFVEFVQAVEPGVLDRGVQQAGPTGVGGGIALGGSVGQGPDRGVFELESQGDLGAVLVADQHGHRLAELVRRNVVVRDLRQSGVLAVCVDMPDEVVDELLARAEAIGGFGQAGIGEDEFGMEREFFGDHDRAGDRFRDPPVLQRPAGILFALAGDDCGSAEELVDPAAAADLPDYWREGVIPTVRYSGHRPRPEGFFGAWVRSSGQATGSSHGE
ncbi:hypothetical protein ACFT9I_18850 [Streptomyces sp. NPDC057137]|uniref:hypothetical protein n=1 Tax=Streptomyces sp. NPDC057137 TaxID=3346030 RepID=UPI003631F818